MKNERKSSSGGFYLKISENKIAKSKVKKKDDFIHRACDNKWVRYNDCCAPTWPSPPAVLFRLGVVVPSSEVPREYLSVPDVQLSAVRAQVDSSRAVARLRRRHNGRKQQKSTTGCAAAVAAAAGKRRVVLADMGVQCCIGGGRTDDNTRLRGCLVWDGDKGRGVDGGAKAA